MTTIGDYKKYIHEVLEGLRHDLTSRRNTAVSGGDETLTFLIDMAMLEVGEAVPQARENDPCDPRGA